MRHRHTIAYLTELRRDELRRAGRPELAELLFHTGSQSSVVTTLAMPNALAVQRKFRELRTEAEEWQRRRTDFMLARPSQGRHPDTEPNFWNGFTVRRPPTLGPDLWEWVQIRVFTFDNGAVGLLALLIGVFCWGRRRSARKTA